MAARIDHGVTAGTFTLDGETFDVENNVWVVGDKWDCIVIDAPHDLAAIVALIDGRRVKAIVCTHAHDDHVRWAPALGRVVQAPVLLHPSHLPLWQLTHDAPPEGRLSDGQAFTIAGETVRVLHTPGHAPGAVCLYVPSLGTVTLSLFAVGLFYLPIALLTQHEVPTTRSTVSLVALAVLCTAIAFVVFFALIARVGPVRAPLFTYLNPIVAIILGSLIIGEEITHGLLIGFPLVIAGCWLAATGGRVRAASTGTSTSIS